MTHRFNHTPAVACETFDPTYRPALLQLVEWCPLTATDITAQIATMPEQELATFIEGLASITGFIEAMVEIIPSLVPPQTLAQVLSRVA